MKTNQELRNLLHQIDRKSYPAYKQLREVRRDLTRHCWIRRKRKGQWKIMFSDSLADN